MADDDTPVNGPDKADLKLEQADTNGNVQPKEPLNSNGIANSREHSVLAMADEKAQSSTPKLAEQLSDVQNSLNLPTTKIPAYASNLFQKRQFDYSRLAVQTAQAQASNSTASFQPVAANTFRAVQATAGLGLLQFHRTVGLGYMQKSLALSYQQTGLLKSINLTLMNVGKVLESKLEAIKHNTAAPESKKSKGFFDQFKTEFKTQRMRKLALFWSNQYDTKVLNPIKQKVIEQPFHQWRSGEKTLKEILTDAKNGVQDRSVGFYNKLKTYRDEQKRQDAEHPESEALTRTDRAKRHFVNLGQYIKDYAAGMNFARPEFAGSSGSAPDPFLDPHHSESSERSPLSAEPLLGTGLRPLFTEWKDQAFKFGQSVQSSLAEIITLLKGHSPQPDPIGPSTPRGPHRPKTGPVNDNTTRAPIGRLHGVTSHAANDDVEYHTPLKQVVGLPLESAVARDFVGTSTVAPNTSSPLTPSFQHPVSSRLFGPSERREPLSAGVISESGSTRSASLPKQAFKLFRRADHHLDTTIQEARNQIKHDAENVVKLTKKVQPYQKWKQHQTDQQENQLDDKIVQSTKIEMGDHGPLTSPTTRSSSPQRSSRMMNTINGLRAKFRKPVDVPTDYSTQVTKPSLKDRIVRVVPRVGQVMSNTHHTVGDHLDRIKAQWDERNARRDDHQQTASSGGPASALLDWAEKIGGGYVAGKVVGKLRNVWHGEPKEAEAPSVKPEPKRSFWRRSASKKAAPTMPAYAAHTTSEETLHSELPKETPSPYKSSVERAPSRPESKWRKVGRIAGKTANFALAPKLTVAAWAGKKALGFAPELAETLSDVGQNTKLGRATMFGGKLLMRGARLTSLGAIGAVGDSVAAGLNQTGHTLLGRAAGTAASAANWAAMGSLFGPEGTLIGAGIGALVANLDLFGKAIHGTSRGLHTLGTTLFGDKPKYDSQGNLVSPGKKSLLGKMIHFSTGGLLDMENNGNLHSGITIDKNGDIHFGQAQTPGYAAAKPLINTAELSRGGDPAQYAQAGQNATSAVMAANNNATGFASLPSARTQTFNADDKTELSKNKDYQKVLGGVSKDLKSKIEASQQLQVLVYSLTRQFGPAKAIKIINQSMTSSSTTASVIRNASQFRDQAMSTMSVPERAAATIQAAKEDKYISSLGSGDSKTPLTLGGLNKGLGLSELVPTARPVQLGSAETQRRQKVAMKYFISQGWKPEQAAGIVANLTQESHLNNALPGDSGLAYGIGQWHPDRQAQIAQAFGKPLQQMSLEEQLAVVQWDLTKNPQEKRSGKMLSSASTAQDAGAIVSRFYERPKDVQGNMAVRGNMATSILASWTQNPSADGTGSAGRAPASTGTPQLTAQPDISPVGGGTPKLTLASAVSAVPSNASAPSPVGGGAPVLATPAPSTPSTDGGSTTPSGSSGSGSSGTMLAANAPNPFTSIMPQPMVSAPTAGPKDTIQTDLLGDIHTALLKQNVSQGVVPQLLQQLNDLMSQHLKNASNNVMTVAPTIAPNPSSSDPVFSSNNDLDLRKSGTRSGMGMMSTIT